MQRALTHNPRILTCAMCGSTKSGKPNEETSWCFKCNTAMVTIV